MVHTSNMWASDRALVCVGAMQGSHDSSQGHWAVASTTPTASIQIGSPAPQTNDVNIQYPALIQGRSGERREEVPESREVAAGCFGENHQNPQQNMAAFKV